MYLSSPKLIVRHALKLPNKLSSECLDIGDPNLSTVGEEQAEALQPIIEALGVTAVITGRNLRTLRTGGIATYGLGVPLHVHPKLNEITWGPEAAGRPKSEVFPEEVDNSGPHRGLDLRISDKAETCIEAAARLLSVMHEVDAPGNKPVLVTSGQIIRAAVATTVGLTRSEMLEYPVPHAQLMLYDPSSAQYPTYVTPDNLDYVTGILDATAGQAS